jgi:hypothetical protein
VVSRTKSRHNLVLFQPAIGSRNKKTRISRNCTRTRATRKQESQETENK